MISKVLSANTMLQAASLFFLVSTAAAEITSRCGLKNGTTFDKTEGGVEGRYTVEWCSQIPDNAKGWQLTVEHIYENKFNVCDNNVTLRQKSGMKTHVLHTPQDLDITNRSECKITCLSKTVDLIFSGCYKISNTAIGMKESYGHGVSNVGVHQTDSTYHRVANMFPSHQDLKMLKPKHELQKNDHLLEVAYNMHYIPIKNAFVMKTKEFKNNSNNDVDWINITDNCTDESDVRVVCRLRYPAPGYCVTLSLEYIESWRNGYENPDFFQYCSPSIEVVEMDPGMDPRVWWAIGALALTLSLLAACWAAHTRVLANLRKKVLHEWMQRYTSYTAEHTPEADPGHILLLYARDCEPAMEAVSVLKEMLEEGAPGRVYDLFSNECVARYADAPEDWVSGVLARPDVRVVLVQTPAAAALYAAQVNQDNLQMQQPLLGARVQYRNPHYGDVLLQFALRLVRDMAPMQQEYARYYIATVSELGSELMPQVAPYRRYELPAHGSRLLADLRLPAAAAGAAAGQQRLRRLDAAVHGLLDYVRANENYLRDELMFI